jgi:hypothetical protein
VPVTVGVEAALATYSNLSKLTPALIHRSRL